MIWDALYNTRVAWPGTKHCLEAKSQLPSQLRIFQSKLKILNSHMG